MDTAYAVRRRCACDRVAVPCVRSVNGELIAKHVVNPRVTCLALTQGPEWCDSNVVVSGHADGAIKFWSVVAQSVAELAKTELETAREEAVAAAAAGPSASTGAITRPSCPRRRPGRCPMWGGGRAVRTCVHAAPFMDLL